MNKDELIKFQQEQTDKLIEDLKPLAREMVKNAWMSGALDEDSFYAQDNYVLAKIIVTILERREQYAPTSTAHKKVLTNLEYFI